MRDKHGTCAPPDGAPDIASTLVAPLPAPAPDPTPPSARSGAESRAPDWRAALLARLFAPVDGASLVVFRIVFGAVMVWEVARYFYHGWITRYFFQTDFHFTYFGFDWVRRLPGDGMYALFWVLGILGACIAVGCFYRAATVVFFFGFTYFFLLEQARYLNHLYLVCLLAFIMIFLPVNRLFAVDTWIWPSLRSATVPTWALWLVRFQIAVPYFYGGIAKLNWDWLQGEPVRMWLGRRLQVPEIVPFVNGETMVYVVAYGGLLLDLLIVPALLWRRTRWPAYAAAVVFHVANSQLFQIGIFPWLMIAATLIFFPPDWPRSFGRFLRSLVPEQQRAPVPAAVAADVSRTASAAGVTGVVTTTRATSGAAGDDASAYAGLTPAHAGLTPAQRATVALLAIYVAWQVLMPFRHLLYPGDVAWNEEGHLYSWRMKLRDKNESLVYVVSSPSTGQVWRIRPREYLPRWQADGMDGRPDMTIQLAHHIADDYRARGYSDVEVRAEAIVSLNGRRPKPLIDPTVDLAREKRSIWPYVWLLPNDEPLRARAAP